MKRENEDIKSVEEREGISVAGYSTMGCGDADGDHRACD